MSATIQPVPGLNAALSSCWLIGVRAGIGPVVTETQNAHSSVALGHRRETRHVAWSLVAVEGMEQGAVEHRLKSEAQTLQLERVGRSELDLEPAVVGLRSGDATAVSATSTPRTDNPSEAR